MKARFNLGDIIVSLPIEYLDQQTCNSSVFKDVPLENVEIRALIEANRANRDIRWYKTTDYVNNVQTLHITIPTDLIEWED